MSSHEMESTQNLGVNGAAPHAAADDIEPHSAIALEATEIIHPDRQAPEEPEMPEKVTLETLAAKSIWVAWQVEDRPDGKPTKVPYAPDGRKARANSPKTWGARDAAEAMARRLPKPYGLGGVGIEFTTMPDCVSLAGIDLDTCRDPATGAIDGWAQTVIQRFDSYTEVSPSGTGAKVFFTYPTEALPNLRAVMGGAAYGKQFKRGTGKDHPPAIELHLGNRYFAVTGDRLPSSPMAFRTVTTDTLLQLLTVDGPAFAGTEQADEEEAEDPDKPPKKPRKQKDRSSTAFRNGAALRR